MRSYVFADMLRRMLQYASYKVTHVINITDVGHLTSDADEGEDKIEAAALREGKTVWDIARHYEAAFKRDLVLLRVQEPSIWARATDHIDEMIGFAKDLAEHGFTYQIPEGLFFDTTLARDYGRLALLDMEGLMAGARVAPTAGKRNPIDFAIWRASPPNSKRLMEWDSPWGKGAPGWHLECSTMSIKYLGAHFDLHTGGVDHIPTHHTNEIAQSEAYLRDDQRWVKYWMHNEFMTMPEGKMAKSTGNVLLLSDLIKVGYHPVVYRHVLAGAHYRKQIDFSWDALDGAQRAHQRLLERIRPALDHVDPGWCPTWDMLEERVAGTAAEVYARRFNEALWNDLNTPQALATLYDASRDRDLPSEELALLLPAFERVLSLGLCELVSSDFKPAQPEIDDELRAEIDRLVAERDAAREARDFATADTLRENLRRRGVALDDSPAGTTWRWA
jgi:cysteinyl-tRNA synthetase